MEWKWNGNGMEWDGMGWDGMEWNRMEPNGMEMEWSGMGWDGMEMEWSPHEVEFSRLSLASSELSVPRLCSTAPASRCEDGEQSVSPPDGPKRESASRLA